MSEVDDILASLGTKLDSLDLTDNERATLMALLDAVPTGDEDDEVAGFGEIIPSPLPPVWTAATFGSYMPRFSGIVTPSQISGVFQPPPDDI